MALCDYCRNKGLPVCELALRQHEESDKMVAGILHPDESQVVAPVDGEIYDIAAAILRCIVFEAPSPSSRLPKPEQAELK